MKKESLIVSIAFIAIAIIVIGIFILIVTTPFSAIIKIILIAIETLVCCYFTIRALDAKEEIEKDELRKKEREEGKSGFAQKLEELQKPKIS